ncbi:MAG: RsmD family RNA methyltransferase [Planctomycetales bacterium]|nr:RsmD family RNA methyltransferase [Planctomycetales bacterium]
MKRTRGQRRDTELEPIRRRASKAKVAATRLRLIAGTHGGRKIDYNGDPGTRPMKERTREAVFSLLGGYLSGTLAIDLFGGTGILAFEAVSRGAQRGLILEMARPAVATILSNMRALGLSEQIEVHNVDTLRWLRNLDSVRVAWPEIPWVVFCCPPYRLWTSDGERLCAGLLALYAACPSGSQFICETEHDFDIPAAMPQVTWDVRHYSPAYISVARKP